MRNHPRLHHLTSHEHIVLSAFLSWLREEFADHIVHVWLFGSKARGDFDDESDLDLLIVAREEDEVLERAVGEMAYDLSLEHGLLLCEHVVSAWRFAQMHARQEFIYTNIVRDGVDLWSLVSESPQVAEERASHNAGSGRKGEDYGTYEDYLRERGEPRQWRQRAGYRFGVVFDEKTAREVVDGVERLIARLERFLPEHGLLIENDGG